MIHLYDANNYVRRLIETDMDGGTPRTILHKLINPTATSFFIWDAEDGLKARRAIYPDYKAKRPPLREDIFVAFGLITEVLKHSRAIQVRIPGYEADDIIAALTRTYAERGERIHIFSNDRDFLQLMAEYPTLVTSDASLKTGVMLNDIRYHKTLVGDPSDSIPGMKGFGDAKWTPETIPAIKRWVDALVTEGGNPGPFTWAGKACENWAADPENQKLLKAYWEIIGFLPMSDHQIAEFLQVGDGDFNKADAILREVLQ